MQAGAEPGEQPVGLHGGAGGEKQQSPRLGGGDRLDDVAEPVQHRAQAIARRDGVADVHRRLPPAADRGAQPQKAPHQLLAGGGGLGLAVRHPGGAQ